MTAPKWPLLRLLPQYFEKYLPGVLNASAHTVSSYRHAWRLFLKYLQQHKKIAPEKMDVRSLNYNDVLAFLGYLEKERKNQVQTRNARLSAIRGAVEYAVGIDPTLPHLVQQILAIPMKKTIRVIPGFLTREEVDALLVTPDSTMWTGHRDRVMLETFYNTGARVSELAGVKVRDVLLGPHPELRLHGKGRKERQVTLWKKTAKSLKNWIKRNHLKPDDPLFPGTRGEPLTRSAVEKRFGRIVKKAIMKHPSLTRLKIGPHTFRHTTAMHLIQAGVDITMVSLYLGHERIDTTMNYLTEDMIGMEKAIGKLQPSSVKNPRFQADDALLAYLKTARLCGHL